MCIRDRKIGTFRKEAALCDGIAARSKVIEEKFKMVREEKEKKEMCIRDREMPHENMEDLSAICYVDFPVESNDGKATMKVKNEHLKMWNVDAKEMFQQARANTQPVNTPILQSMDEMLLSIFNEEGHA